MLHDSLLVAQRHIGTCLTSLRVRVMILPPIHENSDFNTAASGPVAVPSMNMRPNENESPAEKLALSTLSC